MRVEKIADVRLVHHFTTASRHTDVLAPSDTLSKFSELKKTYQEIAEQAGNPVRLLYPAGGFDIHPLLMPSVRTLTIVDATPLLSDVAKVRHTYSKSFSDTLLKFQGRYIDLKTLQKRSRLDNDAQQELLRGLRKVEYYIGRQLNEGYHIQLGFSEKHDNFADVLGGLLYHGADFSTIKMGKFEDEYRIRFQVEGDEKTLIYKNHVIDAKFAENNKNKLLETGKHFADGELALIAKADFNQVSSIIIPALQPNVIISHASNFLNQIKNKNPQYNFVALKNPSYPDLKWGYTTVSGIEIGRKEKS